MRMAFSIAFDMLSASSENGNGSIVFLLYHEVFVYA